MPDVAALQRALDEMNAGTRDLSDRLGEMNSLLLEESRELAEVKERLPSFVPRSRFRSAIALVVVCGLLVAGVVGLTLFLNHQTTCGTRGVLVSARSAIERTPVPSDPAALERRDQAIAFYDESLSKLKILWGCEGEDRASGARP